MQVEPLRTILVSDPGTVVIDTLSTCQSYWVTVTAVNCASRIQSQAAAISVQNPLAFEIAFRLPAGMECSIWTKDMQDAKITSLENAVLLTLNGDLCRMPSVQCSTGSAFMCGDNPMEVTFS